ncbi:MAG TPA: prepilin-type N-terminal cleavage/methylation domain-containing protein [Phycisphaerae bacterium]|nr:prepilin-type N-terminal cleavage/methylation domain-containing protein [Phycisphaerae bacterium]
MADDRMTRRKAMGLRRKRWGEVSWPGFTLIELLVVVSLIALLISILLPALSAAKESAAITQCLANLGEIMKAAHTYGNDNDPTGYGSYPTEPWHLGNPYGGVTATLCSEWVYGGFQTSIDHPYFGAGGDWQVYLTELRPFTKYISPGSAGKTYIKSFVCPSDKSHIESYQDDYGVVPDRNDRYGSWEIQGNSYPINWYWYDEPSWAQADGPTRYGCSGIAQMSKRGSDMLSKKVGGSAAEFPLFWEDTMDAYMHDAKPPDDSEGPSKLQVLGIGWHRKVSVYSAGFFDGHSDYRFYDTRYTRGPGYNIRPGL